MWIIDLRERDVGINKVELVNEEVIIKADSGALVAHHVIDMETFLGKE